MSFINPSKVISCSAFGVIFAANACMAATPSDEQLQALVLVSTPWTVDNDMITPTFKVKRNRIEDVYGRHYESWEASGKPVIWNQD